MIEHRVIGPPGCGKTTYLTRQAALAAEKYGGGGVAIASLTRTAAKEVSSRAEGIPLENIGTLHSHAYRHLSRPAIVETAEGLKAWNDWVGVPSYRISARHAADPENASPEMGAVIDSDGAMLLGEMGVLRARMVDRRLWPTRVLHFAARWDEFKKVSHREDFQGLIERAIEDVDELPDIAVLLLDEAQDMSRAEMTLARKWGAACQQLVIVGDPDQNLYEWRGSEPEAFFAGEASTERVLEQSYRVPALVVELALKWVSQIDGRHEVAYEPRVAGDGTTAIGQLHRQPSFGYLDPTGLVADALEHVAAGRTVMILGACGYMLTPIAARLKECATSFHNPYRPTHGGWNPMRSAGRLLDYLRPDVDVWGDDARIWTWPEVWRWAEIMQASAAFGRGAKTAIESRARGDARRRWVEDDDQRVDIDVLSRYLLDDTARGAVINCDIDWWESTLLHNARKTQQFPLALTRAKGGAYLREEPKVVLGTIHSVKGGEADVVYLLPDLSMQGYWEGYRKPGRGRNAVIRQFYVGMTRAREELVLCGPSGREHVTWPSVR